MKTYSFLFLFSFIFLGCSSEDETKLNNDDYLIFGHFYGFCVGENCIEIFKLTNNTLYEDSNDNYSINPLNFEPLESTKFELVKDLMGYFPEKLLTENEDIIGCPDCADGGGLYIEYSKNGIVKHWKIDQMKMNVPTYLHAFMDKLNEKIALINQ
ncbi:hypothetical protein ACFQ0I_01315 [Mariniflexile aquimaris]|uniref:Lipoprotein n=1 Tax=Mariniflexile aquimaris TaxID=881009 RepID=A0ABW3BMS9_9FLAO